MSLFLFDLDGTLIEGFIVTKVCDECGGVGRVGSPRIARCEPCHGSGSVWDNDAVPDYDRVAWLPGRRELVASLREAGNAVALVTNQGGVAFGHQTQAQVARKLNRVCEELGLPRNWMRSRPGAPHVEHPPAVYVAYGHKEATVRGYSVNVADQWRKPGGGMIEQAMLDYGYGPMTTTYIGDLPTDAEAAYAAGVEFVDAAVFFGGVTVWTAGS